VCDVIFMDAITCRIKEDVATLGGASRADDPVCTESLEGPAVPSKAPTPQAHLSSVCKFAIVERNKIHLKL
jgi:hypothetical protein